MNRILRLALITLISILLIPGCSGDKEKQPESESRDVEPLTGSEKVVAGGPDDFMEVRHIVMRGTNFQIGRKLANIARTELGSRPIRYRNSKATHDQIKYFERYYHVFLERMRGVASAYNKKITQTSWNFAGLYYGVPISGCFSVYYPPLTTESGKGVLSRNFDFTTGTFYGAEPSQSSPAACARPFVIELYPDKGYASIVICCFDLLGGATDGINSEGLTIAMLSDGDVAEEFGVKPTRGPKPGFNEIQIVRYLLDTCANVTEAKKALRKAILYYNLSPNHYIIADRHGDSFLWENSPRMDKGYIIDGSEDEPLITTNFLRHRYASLDSLPEEEHPLGSYNRFRTVRKRVSEHAGAFGEDFVRESNLCVSLTQPVPQGYSIPNRTLWHALYYPDKLSLEVDFYLGEEDDPENPGKPVIRRSGYLSFSLIMFDTEIEK